MGAKEFLKKVKVVLDTNVLISAWFWDSNESRLVELVEEGALEGYASPQLLNELKRALEYPKFRLQRNEVETICDYYALMLKIVEPRQAVSIVDEDPKDDKVLECAVEVQAAYIVSGNHHLLDLGEFRGTRVVRAKELLEKLAR